MAIGTGLAMLAGSAVSAVGSASAAKKAANAQTAAADQATQLQRDIYEQTTANYAPYLTAGNDAMAAYLYEMGMGPRPVMGATAPKVETFTESTGASGPLAGMGLGAFSRGGDVTKYRVNGQVFGTLEEAEKYANANKTGGTEYAGYSMSPMAKYLMEEGSDSIRGLAASSGGLYSGAALEALEGNRKQVVQADTSDYLAKLFGLTNMGMSAAGNQASAGSAYAGNVGNLAMTAANAKGQGYLAAGNAMSGFINDAAGIAGYYGWGQNSPTAAYAAPTMTNRQATRPMANPYY